MAKILTKNCIIFFFIMCVCDNVLINVSRLLTILLLGKQFSNVGLFSLGRFQNCFFLYFPLD